MECGGWIGRCFSKDTKFQLERRNKFQRLHSMVILVNNVLFIWFLVFFQYWGLNSGPTSWATPPALFCDGFFFKIGSHKLLPSLASMILLMFASWVARITGVSHQCPGGFFCFGGFFFVSARVWTQALTLARQVHRHLSHSVSPGGNFKNLFP
jgi:hypothetical protein